jgi:2-hydroxychromene-2-carboxylate isomerase
LILPRILELKKESNININFKLVYPIAIRMPEWFETKNILFFLSSMSDLRKKAKQLDMPLNLPLKPDPIKQNILTAKIAKDQPYIFDICHMGQEMTNRGFGLEFAHKLSEKIWSVKNWNKDEHIAEILLGFDIELTEIKESIKNNEKALISQIKQNQVDQLKAGHHGVPLSVYRKKFFFGQDKFDDLVEYMKSHGDI